MDVVAVSEHQPVAAACAGRFAFLQEAAERRHPGAGPDHDDRTVGIGGQPEMRVRAEEDLQRVALAVASVDVD